MVLRWFFMVVRWGDDDFCVGGRWEDVVVVGCGRLDGGVCAYQRRW